MSLLVITTGKMLRVLQRSRYLPFKNARYLCDTKTEPKYYDVIISGAGMVGTAMACCLGSSPRMAGRKILLLEAGSLKSLSKLPEKYSNRVSSISPASMKLLSNLGAWDYITKNLRYQRVKRLQVWDSRSDAMIAFNHDGLAEDVSYIVENNLIVESLLQTLRDVVDIRDGARVEGYDLPSDESSRTDLVRVRMKDGNGYQTKLLIGADGHKSLVRSTMDVKYLAWNYDQMALVATLHLSEPTENVVAWQRYLPTGSIALLPLTGKLSSLVWCTSLAEAKNLLNMPKDHFVEAINSALWADTYQNQTATSIQQSFSKFLQNLNPVCGTVRQLPPSISGTEEDRAAFLLSLGHSSNYCNPRVVLIGDAAHKVHPHLGLGVNLGFGDVSCLGDHIDKAIYDGEDIGDFHCLKNYESERQLDVLPIMAAIEGLHHINHFDNQPAIVLRSIGVNVLNSLYPIKKWLMNRL